MDRTEYTKLDLKLIKITPLRKIIKAVVEDIQHKPTAFREWLIENFLCDIIQRLYELKYYKDICKFVDKISAEEMLLSDILFEVAYSFNETKEHQKAKCFYNYYLEYSGENSAVCNNLGLLYEKDGDLETALSLFSQAQKLNSNSEKAPSNFNRVKEKLVEKKALDKKLKKTLASFKGENSYIKEKFLRFCSNVDGNNQITCPYRQLSEFVGASSNKAHELIKNWIESNYLNKDSSEGVSVYQVNPYINEYLNELENELHQDKEFLEICGSLDSKSLHKIGFDTQLQEKLLENVIDDELRSMLSRDLKEVAIALLTKSYKSAMVLSGSIIEAILIDRLRHLGVKKVVLKTRGKTIQKKLEELSLSALLSEAQSQDLIDSNLMHLSHGVRGFRNLIHPVIEYRKKSMGVSKQNAELAWNIAMKVICEISEPQTSKD